MDEGTTQQFYIATKSAPPDDRTRVLKYGPIFAVFDRYGDVETIGLGEEGIFYQGTRFLSELALFLGNSRPLLLSSTVREDNSLFTADLTNVDLLENQQITIPRGSLHITRSKFLFEHTCYEQLKICNYGLEPIATSLAVKFDADYADIFEVRGTKRMRKGEKLDPVLDSGTATLGYQGLDGVRRSTRISFSPAPERMSARDCRFDIHLPSKQEIVIEITITFDVENTRNGTAPYHHALATSIEETRTAGGDLCQIHSSNDQFNSWMKRSVADIHMMIVGNPERDYPYAGVPWFSAVFGRDGIITALECLWADPSLARGVLKYLAETQAQKAIPEADGEPGKILHEARRGEMAALGEVPFARYYGSVDATPLFVMLAGAYYERTADLDFQRFLWPHVERALAWMDQYGDKDGDLFIEYSRESANGLVQQGWKDSGDSVFHRDGGLAQPPIALCEVQGYAYAAKCAGATLAAALNQVAKAEKLEREATELRDHFERAFWCEDLSTYALALDGNKRPCRVRTSNPGHCLYTRIAKPEHAVRIAKSLLNGPFFNGWGIRTVASGEARYNPMSYHNGSVWPHDNAIIAAGLGGYGLRQQAAQILLGFLDVSGFVDLHRLPELFCGLDRRSGEGPTAYPVACSPQSWAAAAIYLFLQACLGIEVSSLEKQVVFEKPFLPPPIPDLTIRGLKLDGGAMDLALKRQANTVGVDVLRNTSRFQVIIR
ncbi:MAG: amylo-alpha-1,6-glucosidase, partial [Acidobacteria bacterium]|nr:amylo-alpha-1,6-glucosidase [Acidobacteriota bacterium]